MAECTIFALMSQCQFAFVNVYKCLPDLHKKKMFTNFVIHQSGTYRPRFHKNIVISTMQNIKRNISIFVAAAAVMLFSSLPVQAQELVQRKRGTVLEQIQQSALHNDPDAEIKQLLDYAATFRGTRYRSGSSSPSGFDCSGFTSYVFSKFGYKLHRSSGSQIANGDKVEKNELKPGDLVFFNGRAVGKRIGHVGIVTEVDKTNGTFNFIHASNSQGVTVSTSEEPYYKRRYVGACRPTK